MSTTPMLQFRCPVTGLDLEVTLDGLIDDLAQATLADTQHRIINIIEAVIHHRFVSAAAQADKLAAQIREAGKVKDRWSDERLRQLLDEFEEVAA